MIHFIIKENFMIKKLIERRNEGFLYNKNGYFVKEFKEYSPEVLKQISDKYYDGIFKYVFYECGGEAKEQKDSRVQLVCSFSGEPLPAIKVNRKFVDLDFPHAVFSANHLFVLNMWYKKKTIKFSITEYEIDLHSGKYEERVVWKDSYENVRGKIPTQYQKFANILNAGWRKIHDYQCIKSYYLAN